MTNLAIEISQRLTIDAALGRAADLGGLHDGAPQARAVDPQIIHG